MSGEDRIEFEQHGRTLRGSGSLRVAPGVSGQGGWRVVPHVEGTITFDGRTTSADVKAMADAEMRAELAGSARHAFSEAVVMRQEVDLRRPNAYALQINRYEVVT